MHAGGQRAGVLTCSTKYVQQSLIARLISTWAVESVKQGPGTQHRRRGGSHGWRSALVVMRGEDMEGPAEAEARVSQPNRIHIHIKHDSGWLSATHPRSGAGAPFQQSPPAALAAGAGWRARTGLATPAAAARSPAPASAPCKTEMKRKYEKHSIVYAVAGATG